MNVSQTDVRENPSAIFWLVALGLLGAGVAFYYVSNKKSGFKQLGPKFTPKQRSLSDVDIESEVDIENDIDIESEVDPPSLQNLPDLDPMDADLVKKVAQWLMRYQPRQPGMPPSTIEEVHWVEHDQSLIDKHGQPFEIKRGVDRAVVIKSFTHGTQLLYFKQDSSIRAV